MNAPRPNNAHRTLHDDIARAEDRHFARLLDAALRGDSSPRRRPAIDVTQRVLTTLGFRPLGAGERRARLVKRQGQRLMQAALLAGAALGGVVIHNMGPTAVRGDDALPKAVDRALHGILPAAYPTGRDADMEQSPRKEGPNIDRMLREFDARLLDRLRLPPGRSPAPDLGAPRGDHAGDPRPDPFGDLPEETATAPYRWL